MANPFPHIAIFFASEGFEWHNEDSWKISKRYPIYVVADGVTSASSREAFNPSHARRLADLFCAHMTVFLEKNYLRLSEHMLRGAYRFANAAAATFNRGRKNKIAAVGAAAAIRGKSIFISRLTDSGAALVRDGAIVFKTPEFWASLRRTKKKEYGLMNGTPEMERFVDITVLPWQQGDCLVLFTDGFENHFASKKFLGLFKKDNISDFESSLSAVDDELVEKNHERYGHERTLLAVWLGVPKKK